MRPGQRVVALVEVEVMPNSTHPTAARALSLAISETCPPGEGILNSLSYSSARR